jgi:pimeloyl-[acyl-carrier protein] methyl ester esterase
MSNLPSIALIHGWATAPSIWESVRNELEVQAIEVNVYEMPGYGSRRDESGNLSLNELVDDAIQHLPANALWVGWSLGAMIALSAAARNRSSIAGVLAVCATAKFCGDKQKVDSLGELQSAVENNPSKAVSRFQRSMPCPANRRAISKQLTANPDCSATKETLLSGLKILSRADLSDEVNKIEVPVRLVSGDEDPIIPPSAAIELNGLISGSQFTALPCGHLPFLECPQLFMEQLFEFAQSITGSPTGSKSV